MEQILGARIQHPNRGILARSTRRASAKLTNEHSAAMNDHWPSKTKGARLRSEHLRERCHQRAIAGKGWQPHEGTDRFTLSICDSCQIEVTLEANTRSAWPTPPEKSGAAAGQANDEQGDRGGLAASRLCCDLAPGTAQRLRTVSHTSVCGSNSPRNKGARMGVTRPISVCSWSLSARSSLWPALPPSQRLEHGRVNVAYVPRCSLSGFPSSSDPQAAAEVFSCRVFSD